MEGKVIGRITPAVTHRCCPECGWLMTQTEIELQRYTRPCPRGCKGVTTDDFQPVNMKPSIERD